MTITEITINIVVVKEIVFFIEEKISNEIEI